MATNYQVFKENYESPHVVWASHPGTPQDIEAPGDDKVGQGWTVEKPKHSYFNWYQNRTDMRITELEAKIAWLESVMSERNVLPSV